MHHLHVGEDPHWALYRHRERLEFTDPPAAAPPRPHHLGALRGVRAVISALAIVALIQADTTPVAPTVATPNLGTHTGTEAPQTGTAPGRIADATGPARRQVRRPSALSHHTKGAVT